MSDEIEPADAGPEVLPEVIDAQATAEFLQRNAALIITAQQASAAAPIADLVTRWVFDCIHNSPVAQATEAYNHLVTTALPELRRRLESLGKE
ncbi:MAG: hypothetical protein V4564_07805 [Pseudomonadota bacterium]